MDIGKQIQALFFLELSSKTSNKRVYTEKKEFKSKKFNDISIFSELKIRKEEIEVKSSTSKNIELENIRKGVSQIAASLFINNDDPKKTLVITDYSKNFQEIKDIIYEKENLNNILQKTKKYVSNKITTNTDSLNETYLRKIIENLEIKKLKDNSKIDGKEWYPLYIDKVKNSVNSLTENQNSKFDLFTNLFSSFQGNFNNNIYLNKDVLKNYYNLRNIINIEYATRCSEILKESDEDFDQSFFLDNLLEIDEKAKIYNVNENLLEANDKIYKYIIAYYKARYKERL